MHAEVRRHLLSISPGARWLGHGCQSLVDRGSLWIHLNMRNADTEVESSNRSSRSDLLGLSTALGNGLTVLSMSQMRMEDCVNLARQQSEMNLREMSFWTRGILKAKFECRARASSALRSRAFEAGNVADQPSTLILVNSKIHLAFANRNWQLQLQGCKWHDLWTKVVYWSILRKLSEEQSRELFRVLIYRWDSLIPIENS